MNERARAGKETMQGCKAVKVDEFKYLGSTIQRNRQWIREVKKRVQTRRCSETYYDV